MKEEAADPPIPITFTLPDPWKRRMFPALTRRYGFKPYRMCRQHTATVMVELGRYLDEVTTRVIDEAIHGDSSDATEVKQIG